MRIDVRSETRPEEVQEGGVAEAKEETTELDESAKQDKIEEYKVIPKHYDED